MYIYIYIYIHTYIHTYIYIYIRERCMCVYIYTHIYTYSERYTYREIYTYMERCTIDKPRWLTETEREHVSNTSLEALIYYSSQRISLLFQSGRGFFTIPLSRDFFTIPVRQRSHMYEVMDARSSSACTPLRHSACQSNRRQRARGR